MKLPKTPDMRLDGRHALVVGGTSGIGLACAAALARAGAEITVAGRRAELVEETRAALQAEGHASHGLPLDITDLEATGKAVAESGPFDVLVNAAGTARHSFATETQVQDFDAVMSVNLRAAYFLAQSVANGLIAARRPGSLITISSQMGQVGGPKRAVYCASKHAVEGFTKAMAIDLGPMGIRVNTICPTFILTPLTAPFFDEPETRRWIGQNIPLGRAGEVGDVAGAAVYLASDASALVTGSAVSVDGGWTAG
ncbi:SDR family NAD(P)-dependent oxidoreductase [Psychromarinibacter sp. S121]|uniref:SDR family NAD(P)-dependent oxidoreductase n=1 Tax=Psychromarinibacter sp. S121 TaxID=3415127 RepID=UPI003C7AA20F